MAQRAPWVLAGVGVVVALLATGLDLTGAQSAADQDWPAFALVTGLLLVGLAADEDGLFEAAGHRLARGAESDLALYAGLCVLVVAVTAVLNLDTSVAFLTPVVVHTARRRGQNGLPLLAGCVLLSNAGSLLLPGSNLTNLIVLGHIHQSGGSFAGRMVLPWIAAVVVTAVVVASMSRRDLTHRIRVDAADAPLRPGLGAAAVAVAAGLVIALRAPALPVLAVGVTAAAIKLLGRRFQPGRAWDVLGAPTLLGLFGVAVALGTAGRAWTGPSQALSHLNAWATAGVAAVVSVLVNNLPASSLLSARAPIHPYSLLIGLNLGPNLFASGSLAWLLWMRAARTAGAEPPVRAACRLGVVAAPLSMAAALGALMLVGGVT